MMLLPVLLLMLLLLSGVRVVMMVRTLLMQRFPPLQLGQQVLLAFLGGAICRCDATDHQRIDTRVDRGGSRCAPVRSEEAPLRQQIEQANAVADGRQQRFNCVAENQCSFEQLQNGGIVSVACCSSHHSRRCGKQTLQTSGFDSSVGSRP